MNAFAGSTVAVGTTLPEVRRTVSQQQISAYAEASGDRNPIHVDEQFARSLGLPGTIAHGLLSMGILAEAVAAWCGGSEALAALQVCFSKPLLAGDTLVCSGTVVGVDEDEHLATLQVEAISDRGDRVLTSGRAVVRLR